MRDDQAELGVAIPIRELTKALQCRSLSVTRRIEFKLLTSKYLVLFWRLGKDAWRLEEVRAEKTKSPRDETRVGFLIWSGREDLNLLEPTVK
ncbi:hypothetical protein [Caballeronia sp. LZ019]|uniref:hypothetical protein n=1 Tax=Caballeronia sp. LZ019 TaxID=3038555 RepID=UPI002863AACD|nr:hypothetical protein [Caballeronia sp. LZ019]MDR5811501.1 hypothetical protein [Caballeronia sp. LZ019]